jgi:uncharacterized protein
MLFWCTPLWAAETIPPVPTAYFNDYANVVSAGTRERLNQSLEDFERQTSDQVLVAIYPKMESADSIDIYTVRVFRAWGVGQKQRNNGAVLFVFVQDHTMRITPGYGLEGALPDALCKRILDDEISPRLQQGDFDGAMNAGVAAIMAAVRGEYKGNGQTVNDQSQGNGSNIWTIILVVLFLIAMACSSNLRRIVFYGWLFSGGGWGGGGYGGGYGGGGRGGGGYSGGGGSTGGGGASGSW